MPGDLDFPVERSSAEPRLNMGLVIGGPAIAAVLIGAGLVWATNVAAETAAAERKAELVSLEAAAACCRGID